MDILHVTQFGASRSQVVALLLQPPVHSSEGFAVVEGLVCLLRHFVLA
jgi:hypothetical protein